MASSAVGASAAAAAAAAASRQQVLLVRLSGDRSFGVEAVAPRARGGVFTVGRVAPDSPAGRAGLCTGMVLMQYAVLRHAADAPLRWSATREWNSASPAVEFDVLPPLSVVLLTVGLTATLSDHAALAHGAAEGCASPRRQTSRALRFRVTHLDRVSRVCYAFYVDEWRATLGTTRRGRSREKHVALDEYEEQLSTVKETMKAEPTAEPDNGGQHGEANTTAMAKTRQRGDGNGSETAERHAASGEHEGNAEPKDEPSETPRGGAILQTGGDTETPATGSPGRSEAAGGGNHDDDSGEADGDRDTAVTSSDGGGGDDGDDDESDVEFLFAMAPPSSINGSGLPPPTPELGEAATSRLRRAFADWERIDGSLAVAGGTVGRNVAFLVETVRREMEARCLEGGNGEVSRADFLRLAAQEVEWSLVMLEETNEPHHGALAHLAGAVRLALEEILSVCQVVVGKRKRDD